MRICVFVKRFVCGCFLFSVIFFAHGQKDGKDWLQDAKSYPNYGMWSTQDKKGNPVIIEGEVVSKKSRIITSGDYLDIVGNMADIMQIPDLKMVRSHPSDSTSPCCTTSTTRSCRRSRSLPVRSRTRLALATRCWT